VCSLTREGLQKALDEWNGFGTNENISIVDKHEYVYKYGGESLMGYIVYEDLTEKEPELKTTKYNIWWINID
jgi:hypothetical protein